MLELVSLLLPTLAGLFRRRHELVVENLLLRHQLHIALRSRPRPRLKTRDRFFWLVVRSLYPDWKQRLVLVRPETVVRWHRRGWRLYWRWRSGRHLGRPRLSPEIRELIATMANENPLWAPSVSAASCSSSAWWSVLVRSAASASAANRGRRTRAGAPSLPTTTDTRWRVSTLQLPVSHDGCVREAWPKLLNNPVDGCLVNSDRYA